MSSNSLRSRPTSKSKILEEIRALSARFDPPDGLKEEVVALLSEFSYLKLSMDIQFNAVVKEFSAKINDLEQRITQIEKIHDQIEVLQSRVIELELLVDMFP